MLFDFYLLSANVWRGEVWEAVLGVLGGALVTDLLQSNSSGGLPLYSCLARSLVIQTFSVFYNFIIAPLLFTHV